MTITDVINKISPSNQEVGFKMYSLQEWESTVAESVSTNGLFNVLRCKQEVSRQNIRTLFHKAFVIYRQGKGNMMLLPPRDLWLEQWCLQEFQGRPSEQSKLHAEALC